MDIDLPQLNLPSYSIAISINEDGETLVFDVCRKKNIVLTQEEWVRQNFIRFLIEELGYSKGLIRVEGGLKYNKRAKRSDIVVYKGDSPYMLIECKAPSVKITKATFEQASIYNTRLKAKYVVVTNGLEHYCYQVDFETNAILFVDEIPHY